MSRLYIFADEAGCCTFERKPNVSRFFILCTVAMADCSVSTKLLELRRSLAWDGVPLGEYFHATADRQQVRDQVFEVLHSHKFQVQFTIMEKSKAQEQIRRTQSRFYQHGWYYHFKYAFAPNIRPNMDTLITAASIGQRKERAAFRDAIEDVMGQLLKPDKWRTDFRPAASDPCLQVADYCAWAAQRKYELNDARSFKLIEDKITYSYELFARGSTHYY